MKTDLLKIEHKSFDLCDRSVRRENTDDSQLFDVGTLNECQNCAEFEPADFLQLVYISMHVYK